MKLSEGMKHPGKTVPQRVNTCGERVEGITHSSGNGPEFCGVEEEWKESGNVMMVGSVDINTDPFLNKVDIIAVLVVA